jgi:sec-independent protein translocase protein TatB
MFYLFIFESIGTSELILIGLVALIFLGPRRLPQMARTIGKTMAELRNSTHEFKQTWEREVSFDDGKKDINLNPLSDNPAAIENSIGENDKTIENKIISPRIKEINQEDFEQKILKEKVQTAAESKIEKSSAGKTDWL